MFYKSRLLAFLLLALGVLADTTVYSGGALAPGWENWSWSSTIDFASTSGPGGAAAISVASDQYAALSVKDESNFQGMAGLRFDISGAQPDVTISLSSTADNAASPNIPLSALSKSITADGYTTLTIDFKNLPPGGTTLPSDTWDRITFQAGGNGASYYIKNINVLTELVLTPKFLSAEPLPGNIIAVTSQGSVDLSQVSVQLNNATVALSGNTTYSPPDTPSQTISYFTLSKPLAPGTLSITAGNSSFTFTLPATSYGTINISNTKPISPLVYGVNFPTSADYIKTLGATVSRWGGNAVTAYNPFGHFTNAGADWYFENRGTDSADDWIGWTRAAGSKSMVTIPALDWVAKDTTSYSYPNSSYPSQKAFDPYNGVAGDGQFPNGTAVYPPAPQTNAYTPWNTTLATTWLKSLVNKPDIVTVDNEIEIASSTHQDMHPDPITFDEELQRVIDTAVMAKAALPDVEVAAPSTCAWWFYWTSVVGYTDNTAHNNMDFLPWFLQQMQAHDKKAGKRYLDYLDIHYYWGSDTGANDAAAKALRLRMSRSLYDPGYVDESWIGTSVPAQWNQPNPNAVWLIPRMQQLIALYYPGTKLSISEWNSGTDSSEITGGLLTADVLGIFGRYGVDSATYWATPNANSADGLAFWLYNGNNVHFGTKSVQVNMAKDSADVLGVYAGTTDGNKVSLVLINKDTKPVGLYISNVPTGAYFLRHFGGSSGSAKWQTTVKLSQETSTYVVVPAYAAVFLLQE